MTTKDTEDKIRIKHSRDYIRIYDDGKLMLTFNRETLKVTGATKYCKILKDLPAYKDDITPRPTVMDKISEINPEALYPSGLERAIIGIVERSGQEPLILLDKRLCIEILTEDKSEEDAIEYFDYNVIGAWMGNGTPCFVTL